MYNRILNHPEFATPTSCSDIYAYEILSPFRALIAHITSTAQIERIQLVHLDLSLSISTSLLLSTCDNNHQNHGGTNAKVSSS
jgi:hypothetical protein